MDGSRVSGALGYWPVGRAPHAAGVASDAEGRAPARSIGGSNLLLICV